ncbi:MAG: ABC transporter ATP-binding protein [Woeseiaceae bacterium]|nr:ABC transporter ATP-binding protein [Woeseiaceae bacterium]
MSDQALTKEISVREVFRFFGLILGPEKDYYSLAIVYAIGIGVLSLALPISVQMLVNTIANTGLTTPLVVLSLTLFVLLLSAGALNALRIHLMDMFGRRFYARMVSEIALRSVYALNPFFQDYQKGSLFNRYFDIIIVQKTVPNLLVGGFTVVLQAAVGFVLVSMYHPLFLAVTLVIVLLIWLIWLVWGGRAIRSAIEVSHRKHAAAAWLEGLGGSNGFFKSERHIDEALTKTDAVTGDYIDKHVKHFRHHFAQTLCFLLLYAVATAGVLGIGGWLVIRGELSLGQLVAAELVLSVAFLGISQLGTYLAYFYELCAALDELSLFYNVEQEEPVEHPVPFDGDASIEFSNAQGDARGRMATLNFTVPSGARVLSTAETHGVQRELTNFLKRHIRPASGYVALGGQDIMGIRAHELRQQIIVLDRPNAIEMKIREYLQLSTDGASSRRILDALKVVGLDAAISQLEEGLDTRIAATGWPLTITESMQLKLAAAIIAQPRVLVLGELFDTMPGAKLKQALDLLQDTGETTVIYFSGRPRELGFTTYLHLGYEEQRLFDSFEALCAAYDDEPCSIDSPALAPA